MVTKQEKIFHDYPLTYQIEIESTEIVGLESSPDISTSPWLYHISKLHQDTLF